MVEPGINWINIRRSTCAIAHVIFYDRYTKQSMFYWVQACILWRTWIELNVVVHAKIWITRNTAITNHCSVLKTSESSLLQRTRNTAHKTDALVSRHQHKLEKKTARCSVSMCPMKKEERHHTCSNTDTVYIGFRLFTLINQAMQVIQDGGRAANKNATFQ